MELGVSESQFQSAAKCTLDGEREWGGKEQGQKTHTSAESWR